MDTHEFDYWVQCTRLRSKRHKKRMQREDEDKQLIRKHREEDDLYDQLRNLGWKELKPPVQRGFIRYFILRDDVARTKEALFFQKILDKINTRQWSYRKDFKKKGRRFGKKVYNVREQRLDDVSEYDFVKKFTEKERMYFYEHFVRWKNCKQPLKVYRFAEPWRLVLKVQPYMITKVRVKNLDLEKQKAEVEKFFTHERRLRILKIRHGCNRWKWDYFPLEKYENPLHNKTLVSILEEHWPDQQMKVTSKNPRQHRGFCFIGRCLRLELKITRSTILPRYQFALHHHILYKSRRGMNRTSRA